MISCSLRITRSRIIIRPILPSIPNVRMCAGTSCTGGMVVLRQFPDSQAVRLKQYTTIYGCIRLWLFPPPVLLIVIVWLWLPSELVELVTLAELGSSEPPTMLVPSQPRSIVKVWLCVPFEVDEAAWLWAGISPTATIKQFYARCSIQDKAVDCCGPGRCHYY